MNRSDEESIEEERRGNEKRKEKLSKVKREKGIEEERV